MAGSYPGIVKTKLDGFDQTEYLTGRSEKSARDTFFYYTGTHPSAVRYKNWKFYYTMVGAGPTGGLTGRHYLSLDPDRQHQARPLRDIDRFSIEELCGPGRHTRFSQHRLPLRLEHPADRPAAVAEGA